MENCDSFCIIKIFIAEEVILAEERTTEEEKMHIMEGICLVELRGI